MQSAVESIIPNGPAVPLTAAPRTIAAISASARSVSLRHRVSAGTCGPPCVTCAQAGHDPAPEGLRALHRHDPLGEGRAHRVGEAPQQLVEGELLAGDGGPEVPDPVLVRRG